MKCCLCGGEIEKELDTNGKVFWDSGNNAEPLVRNGRCCNDCNATKVIPARIEGLKND